MALIQKIGRVRAPRRHCERPALRHRFSGSSTMRLQSMIATPLWSSRARCSRTVARWGN